MTKPTVTCCATPDAYCSRIDTLVDLDGVHVVAVVRSGAEVTLTIETPRERQGCRRCGVVALSHGRRTRLLRDVPCAGSAVLLRWRQRTWACPDDACPAGTFTEEFTRQSSSPRGSRATILPMLTGKKEQLTRSPTCETRALVHSPTANVPFDLDPMAMRESRRGGRRSSHVQ